MGSDPPDSSAFDEMWASLPGDVEGQAQEDAKAVATEADDVDDDRATVVPPLPQNDYVRTMMQLGELDDPANAARLEGADPLSLEFPGPPRRLGAKEPGPLRRSAPRPGSTPGKRTATRQQPATFPPLPIAPVPQLAPVNADLTELDTLEGLGPLPSDFFDGSRDAGPPPKTPPRKHILARGGVSVGHAEQDRHLTPTGMRLRLEPGFEAPAVHEDELFGFAESDEAPNSFEGRVADMRSLLAASNFSSALVLAESVLVADPTHAAARACVDTCRAALADKYLSSLGGRNVVPRVRMTSEEIRWLALDHRAGFLLSFVDGATTVEEVLDVSSMPELDALRILFELRTQGVIDIPEPVRRPKHR
jgi:hypothetical protein